MPTIIGAFATRDEAERACVDLEGRGIDRNCLYVLTVDQCPWDETCPPVLLRIEIRATDGLLSRDVVDNVLHQYQATHLYEVPAPTPTGPAPSAPRSLQPDLQDSFSAAWDPI